MPEGQANHNDTSNQQTPVVPIFGVPFSRMNMDETVHYLTESIQQRRVTQVITANPIMIMMALESPDYYRVMEQAELIVPDGAGVVWAAGYVGMPVKERVAGFDLLHRLMQVGEEKRWRVYLLGTSQEIIEETASRLQQKYPLVQIAGYHNGFFGEAEDEEVIAKVKEAGPDLLFVARAANNQEPWIYKHKEALGVPVVMGVGGSFDIISGRLKRAPLIFQKLRLEWLYRLIQEPRRYKRMLALPKFVVKVVREKENVTKRWPTP
ncbi:WecB/TagA/CpsF family glycosyltransferase [Paenibacillus pinihumi]|uniref:WecB/TagA/CpsF family glycosyltransferase n=1 Tax=Paenibacillus pinihumi TaxID=669462 RepID=UPI0005648B52|nr:WecB/TagA/CpsF family glycosyltransferase [Paenibacillus pinihumi]